MEACLTTYVTVSGISYPRVFFRRSHLSPRPSQPSRQQGTSAARGLSPAVSPKAKDMAEVANEAAELKLHSCIGFTGESTRQCDSHKGVDAASFLGRICLQYVHIRALPQRESCSCVQQLAKIIYLQLRDRRCRRCQCSQIWDAGVS